MKKRNYDLFYKMSIWRFLALVMIVFIIIPSSIGTVFTYFYTKKVIEDTYAIDYANAIFSEIDHNFSTVISQLNREVMSFVSNNKFRSILIRGILTETDKQYIINLINFHTKNASTIKGIEIITDNGTVFKNNLNIPNKYTYDGEYLNSLSNQVFKFAENTVTSGKSRYCVLGKNLYSYSNSTLLGKILFYIDERDIGTAYSQLDFSSQNTFFIMSNGKIISHPNKNMIGKSPYFLSTPENNFIFDINNSSKTTYLTHTINNPAVADTIEITGIISNKMVFSAMRKMISIIFAGLLVLSLFSVFIAIFVTKKITNEILNLKNSMINLSNGKKTDIKVLPSNEIAMLENSFNDMAKQITSLILRIEEEQSKLRKSEIEALQSQINPHFIYNSLDTISWKAKKNKQTEIDEMIITLAKYLRIGLHRGDTLIKVRDELEHVKCYMYIENLRFPDLFDVEFDIDETVYDRQIIKIVLQPIVENSIKHGFKNIDYKGHIKISAKDINGATEFTVTDNGCGVDIPNGKLFPESKNTLGGYGLYNVYKRLSIYYADRCKFSFNSSLGNGCSVTIRILN